MILDPKWLEALKLPLRITIGVALASGALLLLGTVTTFSLDAFGPVATPFVIVVFVVSTILGLVGIVDVAATPLREKRRRSVLSTRRAVQRKEREQEITTKQTRAIVHLNHLSKEETRYVADCLRKGTPTFYTFIDSPPVSMLIGKGLVWTTRTVHEVDSYPFSFHQFVWEKLLQRREEFIAKDDERAMEVGKQRRS